MATPEHLNIIDRYNSSDTFCKTSTVFKRVMDTIFSGMAIGKCNDSYSQSIRPTTITKCLWNGPECMGIPPIFNDIGDDCSAKIQKDLQLLTTVFGNDACVTALTKILDQYGDISSLLLLDYTELVRITGSQDQATKLCAIRSIVMSSLSFDVTASPTINNTNTLINYLKADMGKRRVETFRAIFLDCHNRLITDEILWTGSVNAVQVHPREVMRRALEVDAAAIIVAHNHPSQMVQPSIADIAITKVLLKSACALGLTLHDHLIISASSHHSMRIHKSVDPWE